MTINTTPETPTAPPAPEPTAQVDQPAPTPEPDVEDTRGNRDAAKYRRQLRHAEAARDDALALVGSARTELLKAALPTIEHVTIADDAISFDGKDEPARVTTRHGHLRPEALADSGIDLDAVFDGMTVNPDKLRAELARVYDTKPYLFAPGRFIIRADGTAAAVSAGDPFIDAFKPQHTRHA